MAKENGNQSILNFHGIGIPHVGVPEEEKPYWISEKKFSEIICEVASRRNEGYNIAITFDDGNLSDLEIAAPILLDKKIAGDFFILTSRLNQDFYLKPKDVRALLDLGMNIGLHGQDHVDWRHLDRSGLEAETCTARAQLEDIIGKPVGKVAIPFGAYNRRVISHLKDRKFKTIFTSDGGMSSPAETVRSRNSIRSDTTLTQINSIIRDRQPTIKRLKRKISTILRRNII